MLLNKLRSIWIHHTQLQHVTLKLAFGESLGEDVCNLILRSTIRQNNISLFNIITQEVMSHINMFCSLMLNWTLPYTDNTGVVTHKSY